MDSKLYPWPVDFPSNVPPASAIDTYGKAYRLVKNNPPADTDFVGHNKEPHKKISKNLKASDYGTSMFRDIKQIKITRDLCKPQREKHVAVGNLEAKHGKMSEENTRTTHFEAWLRDGTGIESSFKIEDK